MGSSRYPDQVGAQVCRLLPIAPSTYHAHMAPRRDPACASDRVRRGRRAAPRDRAGARRELRGSHGARKVWRQLRREGVAVARCTVERLMRAMGLRGAVRGKTVKTTVQNPAAPCPLDRVRRQFHAPAPDRLWVSDFTYVATWQGFAHVAFVIDAYARRIVGWRVSRTATAGFVPRRAGASHPPAPARQGYRADRALGPRVAVSCHSVHRAPGRGRHRAPRWARWGTPSTMPSRRRSSASSRPRSSAAAARGAASRRSSSPPSNRRSARSSEWVDWFNHRRLLGPIGHIPPTEAEAAYHAQMDAMNEAA